MERNKKSPLLFLLLALPLCTVKSSGVNDCPSLPVKNLTCYNDLSSVITCLWNSTYLSDPADSECTIHAKRVHRYNGYEGSCVLEPVDVDRPTLKKCSVHFERQWIVQSHHVLTINLRCNRVNQSYDISYQPACHIKLDPPPKPNVNFTTVSWFTQTTKHERIAEGFQTQLQWRQADQSWSDPPVEKGCKWDCTAELNDDELIQDEKYEARVRVRLEPIEYLSTWSDWSPTASWASPIGRAKPAPPPSDVAGGVLGFVACAAVLVILLILLKTDRTTWIYIVKKISGPPLPSPGKSSLQGVDFQIQLSPYFTSESFHALSTPVEIASVEVTSAVDAVIPSEAALREKMRSENSGGSASSSFSNPSYSQVPPPLPPVSSLTAGNLEPCGADTPYGPVVGRGEDKNAEQDREEGRGKEMEILELLSKGSNNSESMAVISDYEKVEKPQVERFRLQSLDSGVCSGEEVSQESLEADSINMSDCHDEGPEAKEEREGGNGKEGFQRLFGGTFDKGSIQICSDYERVQADCPELASLDSGISSGGEEQLSQEEGLEDVDKSTESTSLLFPPPSPLPLPTSALACSLHSFAPMPLNFSGPGLSPALRPLPDHILERVALMSTNGSVEPSCDGYMPKQTLQSI